MNKYVSALFVAGCMAVSLLGGCGQHVVKDPESVSVQKSQGGNPIVGCDFEGTVIDGASDLTKNGSDAFTYGGDPSVLLDGDTVYLYTGHDESTDAQVQGAIYNIPEYLCYSTKDLKSFKYEGVVMDMKSVKWANDDTSAWASQVMKHHDPALDKDMYYLYFCSWDRTAGGKQSIGVAVSESPTGPFIPEDKPVVSGLTTAPETSSFNDIDPTAWITTDERGNEHRYLAWGNGLFYICELNEDMISVKDRNGDGRITSGTESTSDIINAQKGLQQYTEAPWLYRRKDKDGNEYGDYYLFFAYGWRESMSYATSSNPLGGVWDQGDVIMPPTATSNTNHMAVFDFNGQTYFIYHNGSLPGGSGFRRSACITKLEFDDDGKVLPMYETASGLDGTVSTISVCGGKKISHTGYTNSTSDIVYPYNKVKVGEGVSLLEGDDLWVIGAGKADPSREDYVSIQSENKPGLFITVKDNGSVALAQNSTAVKASYERQTFRTTEPVISGVEGISLESVSKPGFYLTSTEEGLTTTEGGSGKASVFLIHDK